MLSIQILDKLWHVLKKPSIKKRIIISIFSSVFLMILVLLLFIISIQHLDNYVNLLIHKGTIDAATVRRIMERVSITQLNIQGFIFSRTKANYIYSKNALLDLRENLKDAYNKFSPDTENTEFLSKIIHLEQINLDIFNKLVKGVNKDEVERLKVLFYENSEKINKVLTRFNNKINIDMITGSNIISGKVRLIKIEFLIFVIVILIVEFLIAYYLVRSIIPNINHLVEKTLKISQGDLSQRVSIKSGDEMEHLAANFNRMLDSLSITQKSLVEKNKELISTRNKIIAQAKLALLGQMSAGVAHEIRNPLNAIKGAAEFLLLKAKNNPVYTEYLNMINEEVERLNRIVTEFMSLAKHREPMKSSSDIESILNKAIRIVSLRARKKKIGIFKEIEVNPNKKSINIDSDQINQVLLNIMLNAVDALFENGKIYIKIKSVKKNIDDIEKEFILISIKDTGPGISDNIIEKLFDPFFTTKTKGMGLGLSLSNEIIAQHDGFIEVHNENGACFEIYLPIN